MAAIISWIGDFIERNRDPRTDHWTIVQSPLAAFAIVVTYLLTVLVFLPKYMENRKPYNITTVIRWYNIFQVVACLAMIYMIATAGWWQGEYSWGCQPVDYSNNFYALKLLDTFYWLYWLKVVELVETVFFVLRKKFNQVSGLHLYHHASTLLLVWFGAKFIGGGMASFPVMVNCMVHVLMYTYYYLSALGPKWQKRLAPWKPKLTIVQMIQFTLVLIHASTALPSSCKIQKGFLAIYVPNVILVYKMFYDFYTKTYNNTDINNNKVSKTNKPMNNKIKKK